MNSAATFTSTGSKAAAAAKLDKAVFEVLPENHELLHSAYRAYLDNSRANLAKVKTRGEVRGGGKKPWRQKGTGRARFGSSRVPIWRGGGITFGPTGEENYSKKLNVQAKRQALRQALSLSAKTGKIKVIESLSVKTGKTVELVKFLSKIEAKNRVLLVVKEKDPQLLRVARNIPNVRVCSSLYLNVFDLLNADSVVINRDGLTEISNWLGVKK